MMSSGAADKPCPKVAAACGSDIVQLTILKWSASAAITDVSKLPLLLVEPVVALSPSNHCQST